MQLKGVGVLPYLPEFIKEEDQNEKTIRAMKDIALDIAKTKPEVIVIVSKEGNVFSDVVSVDYEMTLKGNLTGLDEDVSMEKSCDMGLLEEINRRSGREELPVFMLNQDKAQDFGVEVTLSPASIIPLTFVDKVYPEYKIVQVTAGEIGREDLYKTGMIIREAIEANKKPAYVLVAENQSQALESGNETYKEAGLAYDAQVEGDLGNENYLSLLTMDQHVVDHADTEGFEPLVLMLGMFEKIKTDTDVLSYEDIKGTGCLVSKTSFNLEGDFILPSVLEEYQEKKARDREVLLAHESEVIKMIRAAAELWIQKQRKLDLDTYLETMQDEAVKKQLVNQKAGVYVTVFKDNRLRGRMGSVSPTAENVGQALINYTIEALSYDPQFVPVEEEELPQLTFNADIVERPEIIDSADELDPVKYGVVVEQGVYRGGVLPNQPEYKKPGEQVSAALEKAGLHPEVMDPVEKLVISRFETEHFE